ncbi:MAG: hypothetical protein ABI833_23740 [Acidobacteriota bacterium]
MEHLPKPVKNQLANLVRLAHEAALRQALSKLGDHSAQWQRGEIDSFQLADRIHEFHDGPNREIYKQFTYTGIANLPMLAAFGIAKGLINATTVPKEVLPYIETCLSFYRQQL